jgi:ABC-2 type transport system permease protein
VIAQALVVLRKELAEMFGDWHSAYGALIQGAILIAICGVVVPGDKPVVWLQPDQLALLYGMFPAVLAATFAADSFAGERERKTLETLLATPIEEGALFLGKLIAAILLAVVGSSLAVVAGVISTRVSAGVWPLLDVGQYALLVVGAGAFGSITAALATHISMRVPVARTAQQMSSMLSVLITAVLAFALHRFHLAVTWDSLPRIIGGLAIFGVALAVAGVATLRREAVFDPGRRRRVR